jgi:hypothetical protein
MATVQSSNRLTPRVWLRNNIPIRGPSAGRPSPSLLQSLVFAGRRLLGAVLLLLGILMISTLVLVPVGLPVTLFAVAMIAAPGRP